MKKIMKFPLAVALLLFLGMSAQAQDKKQMSAEEKATEMTEQMKANLALTDDQIEKVKAVNLDFAQKKEAIHQKAKPNAEPNKDEIKTLKEAHHNELKKVLTNEQYQKHIQNQQHVKNARPRGDAQPDVERN